RRVHDVLDDFDVPPVAYWKGGWGRREGSSSGPICHWDLAPYNVVKAPDGSLAVIDWDGCGPGDRMAELAYAIDAWVPVRRDAACVSLVACTPDQGGMGGHRG